MVVNGIDTITVTYNLQECGISKSSVIDAMYSKEERYKYKNGEDEIHYTYWTGNFISPDYHTIGVYCSDERMTINGSIPKFVNGNNFQGIDAEQMGGAFEVLSNVVGADMGSGVVTRVDYASNLFMNHNPKLYYQFFGNSHKFKRLEMDTTLTYKGSRGQARSKVLMDKSAWAKDTKNKIPDFFEDKNIIRFENRLMSSNRIAHALGLKDKPTLEDIMRIDNLLKLHDDWKRQYFKIQKQHNIIDFTKYMQKDYYTPNQMMQVYILTLIQESGNESLEDLMRFIREEKKFGTGQVGYNNTSRFLKKIKELKSGWIANDNDMVKEIDHAVNMTDYML